MIARIAHIILAFLLFFSSTGLLVNKHYCQEELKSIAVFAQAKACQHTKTVPCAVHGTMVVPADEKQGCCNNESEYLKADTDWVTTTIAELNAVAPLVLVEIPSWVDLQIGTTRIPDCDVPFRPPPLRERLARLQSYLC